MTTRKDLAGGFSLRHPNHKYGIFGALAPIAPTFNYPIQEGWQPLNPNSLVPAENPLFALLKASLQASPPPTVMVNGQEWPVMPLAGVVPQDWIDFNSGTHKLIDAFETWIADGKLNDTPKSFKLTYDGWTASPPKLWPSLTDHNKPGFKATPFSMSPACRATTAGGTATAARPTCRPTTCRPTSGPSRRSS